MLFSKEEEINSDWGILNESILHGNENYLKLNAEPTKRALIKES